MGFRIFRHRHSTPQRVFGVSVILRRVRRLLQWVTGWEQARIPSTDEESVMYVYGRQSDPVLYSKPRH